MPDITTVLGGERILPVVVLDDAASAAPLAEALRAGGIGCAEITLRTPAGLPAIRRLAGMPGFVVGAGTVISPDQVDAVVDAGASFAVTPGFDDAVVARALELGLPLVPGVATPTDIMRALSFGLSHLKLFPAGLLGGLEAVRALAGPFPEVRFLPSGGVSEANAEEYLRSPSVFAISGSWMVPADALRAGDFERIARLSTAAAAIGA